MFQADEVLDFYFNSADCKMLGGKIMVLYHSKLFRDKKNIVL